VVSCILSIDLFIKSKGRRMKLIVLAATLLAAAGAQAQLVDAPSSRLSAEPDGRFGPLAAGFKRYSPLYGGNESANPNDRLFPGFRTDPNLVLGYAFNQYLSVETGYSHLRDKGFHKIDTFDPREAAAESAVAAGALGVKSHTTYIAARLTVPVSERLSAYGKFGIAHSKVENDGFISPAMAQAAAEGKSPVAGETGSGPYAAVGAKYKLNDRATLKGEYRMNGSASKFGSASNASGLKGSVGIGF
jgi:opacity protein-like surface antigen